MRDVADQDKPSSAEEQAKAAVGPRAAAPAAPAATPPAEPADQGSPQPQEERYNMDGWRARARQRFGVSPHAIAGALAGDDRDDFSEADVQAALDRFSTRQGLPSEEGSS